MPSAVPGDETAGPDTEGTAAGARHRTWHSTALSANAFRKFALAIRRSQQPVPSRAGLRAPENVPPSALFFASSVGLARVRA
jgi:hypothetical protein